MERPSFRGRQRCDLVQVPGDATEGHLRHLSWKEISREILLRNRLTQVVAFGVRNWYAVEAWVEQRASTLRREKLKFYVAHLAREADRFEFLLTGKDIH